MTRKFGIGLLASAGLLVLSACGGGGGGSGTEIFSTPAPTPSPPPSPSPTPTPSPTAVRLFATPPATQQFAQYSDFSPALEIRYDSATATYEVSSGDSKWWALRPSPDGDFEFGNYEPGVWFSIAGTPDDYQYSRLARWGTVDSYESFGIPTPSGAVPTTGSAIFTGPIEGESDICFCNGPYPSLDPVGGSITLAFDFGAGSLSGSLHPVLYALDQGGWTAQDLGTFAVDQSIFGVGSTTFSGAFVSTASGANGFSGQFTGPNAEEMIGKWALSFTWSGDGGNHVAGGAFIGKR